MIDKSSLVQDNNESQIGFLELKIGQIYGKLEKCLPQMTKHHTKETDKINKRIYGMKTLFD